MKSLAIYSIFFVILLSSFSAKIIDRQAFYKVLSDNSKEGIDREIARLGEEKGSSLSRAYLGAMYMKKSGFVKGAGDKIRTFKKGAVMLEEEIKSNPSNVEYRFLRLTVQENAPKILKYDKQLNEDKRAIIEGYERAEPDLKKIIKNYAAGSKVIKVGDLNK
jgi:hypothetical protein